MIYSFNVSELGALHLLLSGSDLVFPVSASRYRGSVSGIVKFNLIHSKGIYLIQRTYIPESLCKNSRMRFISLDCFLNEYKRLYSSSFVSPIDDLPFN